MRTTTVQLGEVATIARRVVGPGDILEDTPYVGLENLRKGGDFTGISTVKRGELASAKFSFSATHVLFGKLRPNLAKVARPHFSGVCSTDILPIHPGAHLDRDYLAFFLLHPRTVALATHRAHGANLPRLSPDELERFRIPLPPLEEQRRIARVLGGVDALTTKQRKAMEHTGSLPGAVLAGLMAAWTGRGEGVTPLGEVVREIRIGPFGTALHRDDYVTGGVPVLNPTHIGSEGIHPDDSFAVDSGKYAELSPYHLHEGDVILGRRGEMGRCAVVGKEHAGMVCGTGSMVIRPNPAVAEAAYLQGVLSSKQMRSRLGELALGATMPNLNKASLAALPIPVLPIDLQDRYCQARARARALRQKQSTHLAQLDALFSSLQSRAFSGEL